MTHDIQPEIEYESPILRCHPLPPFDVESWEAADTAFAQATHCELRQSWRETPQPGFRPATVRLGWRDHTLWLLAEMQDVDIFNSATALNQDVYQMGDVFEMFFHSPRHEDYFEFHVTPNNERLQYRLVVNARAPWSFDIEPLNQRDLFLTRAGVWQERELWKVLAGIPAPAIGEKGIAAGDIWQFSFSRYDYTRSRKAPILSSTSAHQQVNFHRRHEWGQIIFMDS